MEQTLITMRLHGRSDGDAIELDHDNRKQLWLGWLTELILYNKTKKKISLMFFLFTKKKINKELIFLIQLNVLIEIFSFSKKNHFKVCFR